MLSNKGICILTGPDEEVDRRLKGVSSGIAVTGVLTLTEFVDSALIADFNRRGGITF